MWHPSDHFPQSFFQIFYSGLQNAPYLSCYIRIYSITILSNPALLHFYLSVSLSWTVSHQSSTNQFPRHVELRVPVSDVHVNPYVWWTHTCHPAPPDSTPSIAPASPWALSHLQPPLLMRPHHLKAARPGPQRRAHPPVLHAATPVALQPGKDGRIHPCVLALT